MGWAVSPGCPGVCDVYGACPPQEARITRLHGRRKVPVSGRPSIIASSFVPARHPSSWRFRSTVVSGGRVLAEMISPIVEADQRHIVRHPDPALAQRVRDAAGQQVAAAEDRIDGGIALE